MNDEGQQPLTAVRPHLEEEEEERARLDLRGHRILSIPLGAVSR